MSETEKLYEWAMNIMLLDTRKTHHLISVAGNLTQRKREARIKIIMLWVWLSLCFVAGILTAIELT